MNRGKPIGFMVIFLFVMNLCLSAFAETIILKTGDKIEGNVIEESDKYIKIDFKGVAIVYYPFEVESIDGNPVSLPKDTAVKGPAAKNEPKEAIKVKVVTAEEYLRRGIAYYGRNSFDLAFNNFNSALAVNANFAEAYLNRGLVYAAKGKPEQAVADYNKAIEINPKYEQAYYLRGMFYLSQSKLDESIADFNKAIELSPKYIQAYLNRGIAKGSKGSLEQAIADINNAIKINPNVAESYYIRGITYANKGNLDQAISDYTKAIELNSGYLQAYLNRGLASAYKVKFNQTQADPNSPKAYINIGVTYNDKGDFARAIADCNKAIELNSNSADAYAARARIYILMQEFDKAWEDVHKVEELGAKLNPQFIEELKKLSGKEK